MATNSRFLFLTVLFLLLVSLSSFLVSASQLEDAHAGLIDGYTPAEIQRNAQRKSLGMPPIPPRALRKKKNANKGLGRTKDGAGRAMVPFVLEEKTTRGYIAIHQDGVNGPLHGYLSMHKLVPKMGTAVEYTYTSTGYVVEILVVGSNQRMCVSAGLYGRTLGLGKKTFHLARHTTVSTAEGDVPFHDLRTASYLETTIFSIDPETNEIEVTWVNPDGSRPPVQIALHQERIYYTGDLSSFSEYLEDEEVLPVALKWVSVET